MIAIAIDGPAGAGKSTIARRAAAELGFIYADTGALYRTGGLAATRSETDLEDSEKVNKLLDAINVELKFIDGIQHIFLDGEDVSEDIRTPSASMMASKVSAIPAVREYLLELQRDIADKNNVIMDGRDIGTVVLPNAKIKIFLTAAAAVRAERRCKELTEKGFDVKFEDVLKDIIERDYNDSHREIAPLKPAEDSITVDTSNDNLEQAIERLLNVIRGNL